MDKFKLEQLLNELLSASKMDLLPQVASLSSKGDAPTQSYISIKYDEEIIDNLTQQLRKWQYRVREVLSEAFGDTDKHTIRFAETISKLDFYETRDAKRFIKRELNDGITYIEALLPCIEFINIKITTMNSNQNNKTPKLFISHSSKDKEFVNALVDLLEYLGFDESILFCSSIPGFGIPLGQNIFDYLRSQFEQHNLFVIFIHSPQYYESSVCLNEMGAAWILKNSYFSFLTKEMDFQKMNGVVSNQEIAVKVDAADAKLRLNELRDSLLKYFGLQPKNQSRWENKRDEFLRITNE